MTSIFSVRLNTHSIKEDHMPQQNYLDELTPALRLYWRLKKPLAVYYVMTLPVVRLARHRPIRGNLFAQSTFVILKALPRQFAKIMPSVPFVPECARRRNYVKAGCTRAGVDTPH